VARAYHSASSIKLAQRCRHAWALRYLEGIRQPELTWAEIEAGAKYTSRQRATALGKEMHARLEVWYLGKSVNWRDLPGTIALSGLHLLPHPDHLREAAAKDTGIRVAVEEPLGSTPLPPGEGPKVALRYNGILWAGYKDLVVYSPAHTLLFDYKSSANIERYALTSTELHKDLQANLYAADIFQRSGVRQLTAGWVYFETKRVRRAARVVTTMTDDSVEKMLAPAIAFAKELDAIADAQHAPKNTNACGDFGGCEFHHSVGGPCNAQRSIGGLIQARVKKENTIMTNASDPAITARFNAIRAKQQTIVGVAPPAILEEVPPSVEPEASGRYSTPPVAETVIATRPTRKLGRPKATIPPPANGVVGIILSLQTQLAEAQAAKNLADARVEELLSELRAALAT
jgi:hypothetical protein